VTTQATTHKAAHSEGSNPLRLALTLAAVLVALVAMILVTEREARAALTEKIVFDSNRTTGTGVNNPTGDYEIFKMNPDGTGVKQLTTNKIDDYRATLSPGGKKIVYVSYGKQTSNPEGDEEVYVMNADGSGQKNLTNNGAEVNDDYPVFSPGGKEIAYVSRGVQTSNPEGDHEVYVMSALDGSGQTNLTYNGNGVFDYEADFSPNGTKIVYQSYGVQTSNPEGDQEVYVMNALVESGEKNLTNNGTDVHDFAPRLGQAGDVGRAP